MKHSLGKITTKHVYFKLTEIESGNVYKIFKLTNAKRYKILSTILSIALLH